MAEVHHEVELGLNACGVECCPHAGYTNLVAVASYLHRPGDDDEPQSRVGQLFMYDLARADPAADADASAGAGERSPSTPGPSRWTFAPAAPALDTRAIFELKWAPSAYTTAAGPLLAQADAGGSLVLYAVAVDAAAVGGVPATAALRSTAELRCGGGGLGMATCVDWNPSSAPACGGEGGNDLAVCGADGGLRLVALGASGDLAVTLETDAAHDLEAWAVAFSHPNCAAVGDPGSLLFSGADDAAFKGWDPRAGIDRPVFVNRRGHEAGVTCVAPSPHDPHAVATGSYDDNVRLWDVRSTVRPVETCRVNCGGGAWRCRWHPTERRLACAAMGGGAVTVDWTGAETEGGSFEGGELTVATAYDGHGSIAYGADWFRGRRGVGEDVVVSCSFYDKGLHVWSPSPRAE